MGDRVGEPPVVGLASKFEHPDSQGHARVSPRRGSHPRPARSRAGRAFSRQVRLRQVRGCTTQDLVLLLQQSIALAQLTKLRRLRRRHAGLAPGLHVGLAQPVQQAGLGDPEIIGNLPDRHPRLTALGNRHDIIAELSRIGLRHDRHPSSGTPRHHRSDVTYPCGRPTGLAEFL